MTATTNNNNIGMVLRLDDDDWLYVMRLRLHDDNWCWLVDRHNNHHLAFRLVMEA